MEEENRHIDELIASYLTEGLDKNALDELKTWIVASAENRQYFLSSTYKCNFLGADNKQ